MKKKQIDTELEEGTQQGTEEADVDTELTAEEEEARLNNVLSDNVDKIIKALRDNPVRKQISREGGSVEKSVFETDPSIRKFRPFVQLSKGMEEFVNDVRAVAKGRVVEKQSVIEGVDEFGGFLVPEEFHAEVIRFQNENAIVRPRARVFTMARDTFNVPSLDQSASRFGGVSFTYEGETEPGTFTRPTFGKITLSVKKLMALCAVSNEMLADSAINIANFLVNLYGEALTYREDTEFLTGNGVARPLGIIADPKVPALERQTAGRITFNDIVGMYERLPAWASANAAWITTKAGVGQLMRMRADAVTAGDSAGAMIFQPSMQQNVPMLLHGKPVLETDKLPAVGAKGDLILGDLRGYFIGDRGTIQVASSIHDRFTTDEVTLRFTKRHDGLPGLPNAFVVLDTFTP